MIDKKIETYHSDRTGQVDYALQSAGGTTVPWRSSPSMSSGHPWIQFWGFPILTAKNNPDRAIQADNTAGNCWAIEGSKGHLVLKLSRPVHITHLTLEHISKAISPSGSIQLEYQTKIIEKIIENSRKS